jgi:hypothetical protein
MWSDHYLINIRNVLRGGEGEFKGRSTTITSNEYGET